MHFQTFALEGYQLSSETESCSRFWKQPFRSVWLEPVRSIHIEQLSYDWLFSFIIKRLHRTKRENRCVTKIIHRSNFTRQLLRPSYATESLICRELKHNFSSFKVSHNRSCIFGTWNHKIGVFETPWNWENTWLVQVLKCRNWILWITQIPNIEAWISVVIVCNNKLCWYEWVPHHLCFFRLDCLVLLSFRLSVKIIIFWYRVYWLVWLSKLEDRFTLLQIPHDDFSVFRSTRQNMWHYTIPTYGCYSMTFVEVRFAWFELCRLFELWDVLDEDFATTRC